MTVFSSESWRASAFSRSKALSTVFTLWITVCWNQCANHVSFGQFNILNLTHTLSTQIHCRASILKSHHIGRFLPHILLSRSSCCFGCKSRHVCKVGRTSLWGQRQKEEPLHGARQTLPDRSQPERPVPPARAAWTYSKALPFSYPHSYKDPEGLRVLVNVCLDSILHCDHLLDRHGTAGGHSWKSINWGMCETGLRDRQAQSVFRRVCVVVCGLRLSFVRNVRNFINKWSQKVFWHQLHYFKERWCNHILQLK